MTDQMMGNLLSLDGDQQWFRKSQCAGQPVADDGAEQTNYAGYQATAQRIASYGLSQSSNGSGDDE